MTLPFQSSVCWGGRYQEMLMFFAKLQKPLIAIKDLFVAVSLLVWCCSLEEYSLVFLIIKRDMKI